MNLEDFIGFGGMQYISVCNPLLPSNNSKFQFTKAS